MRSNGHLDDLYEDRHGKNINNGVDTPSRNQAVLSQLDDDVYDLARSAGASSTQDVDALFTTLHSVLCDSTPSWILRSEFRHRRQRPMESVLQYQQALRLLDQRAYPGLTVETLVYLLLEKFVNGVSDTEVRKVLLR
ncbi:unnamed protein product [Dibothriocephalus latus]|uniref:Uncharacterized protein n=1 Tax=Dibothriocephalus latus TaxID=60516 RepID=A0A3P7NZD2_DIBLA|nr:unnamed protein product [Dibothriocephalus latus]